MGRLIPMIRYPDTESDATRLGFAVLLEDVSWAIGRRGGHDGSPRVA
jgi:hypothetical protein